MPGDEYVVKTKPIHCLLGILIGGVLLCAGLDLHFFRALRGWRIGPDSPVWIVLSGVGALVVICSVRGLVSPQTRLKADSKGITIYAGNASVSIGTNRSVKSPRLGDPCTIPWNLVRQIGVGQILAETRRKKGTGLQIDAFGGKLTIGAKSQEHFVKTLQVLCDRSVKLQGFGSFGVSEAWNGYSEEEQNQMEKKDRDRLRPEDLHSGFAIRATYLPGGLDRAVKILEELRIRYSQV